MMKVEELDLVLLLIYSSSLGRLQSSALTDGETRVQVKDMSGNMRLRGRFRVGDGEYYKVIHRPAFDVQCLQICVCVVR